MAYPLRAERVDGIDVAIEGGAIATVTEDAAGTTREFLGIALRIEVWNQSIAKVILK